MPELGTLETHFNRKYIYLNPDPFLGPSVWRLSNVPPTGSVDPDANKLKDIYTLLPINKTEAGTTTNLFFDIDALPTTREASNLKNYISTTLSTFLAQADVLPRRVNFGLVGLVGEDPIKTIVQDNTGIIYFDMSDLPNLEDVGRKTKYNIRSSSFRYNSRSIDSLTASEPLYSQTSDETATVSLDFGNLPDA